MIGYDVYLLQLVFHPVAVAGRLVLILERDSTKRETTYNKYTKTILKHRIHNRENKNTKRKTNIKKYKTDILIPSSLLHVLRHPSNTTPRHFFVLNITEESQS